VADLLSKGYARESKSPIAAPLMYVPKKDSNPAFRPVVDYRCLNTITKHWHHPLPLPDDIFAAARSAQIFSHLDLRSTFYLIRIKPEDIWKTAFVTPDGQYEYEVMPFGLTNAPAAFQHMIDSVFANLSSFARAFMDDILIYSCHISLVTMISVKPLSLIPS
jgi:hypothetical protein